MRPLTLIGLTVAATAVMFSVSVLMFLFEAWWLIALLIALALIHGWGIHRWIRAEPARDEMRDGGGL